MQLPQQSEVFPTNPPPPIATHPTQQIDPIIEASNKNTLAQAHRLIGIALGTVCGVMGLHNFWGIAFYLIMMLVCNIVFRTVISLNKTTPFSKNTGLLTAGIGSELFSFIFFWTLVFNLIYIFS